MILVSNITKNVQTVRERIAHAARLAGRHPDEIVLIAVSKNRSVDEIRSAVAAGITHLGENRVQEAMAKWCEVGSIAAWHMIGTLQTNKAALAMQFTDLIHSLDRPSLAAELARQAVRQGRAVEALVQVNVSGEETKHGLPPTELEPFLEQVAALGGIQVKGLMTIAPEGAPAAVQQSTFSGLRELARRVDRRGLPGISMRWLSMGMSDDFETAIAEGANMVRIGSAIFGNRSYAGGA